MKTLIKSLITVFLKDKNTNNKINSLPIYSDWELKNLKEKIKNNQATDMICNYSGKPIFLNESFFLLACEKYHLDVEIDSIINEVTNGVFKNRFDFAEDEEHTTGYFFIDKLKDRNENIFMYNRIIKNRFYYDESGKKIEFTI